MDPEMGNSSIVVHASDVAAAAAEVGITRGDTVFFHSSLSSMGHVEGGPNAVIDGFFEAVGPEGTVAVPTLCNWAPGEQHLVFERWDIANSPSFVGAITEAMRKRPDAIRSDHATHSVAAIGAGAEDLTAGHGSGGLRPGQFGPRAFAAESPWERLIERNAAYCLIGVTFRVCTMVHYVEAALAERMISRAPAEERERMLEELAGWMKPGFFPAIRIDDREVIEGMLADRGIVRYGRIGSATLRCARAKPMVENWIGIIEADPERWLPEDYVEWAGAAAGRGA
ncbi:MAG: AAC(3) family N-acetyltransferase [candidate division WS1 bacterium]|jgi:aminoglycoside 3-N-acetyltransferase|nr:AAC(3) family N-acetyltransferase [candidate division WS1 bacterium]